MKTKTYHYGECEMCDTPLEERYIKQDFWLRGELIVVDHVLAGVCPRCGEKVVTADVGQQILKLLENAERIATAPRMSVPVVTYNDSEERYMPA